MSRPLSELPLGFRPVRHPTLVRWVMLCAIAEGIGMTAAAASARLTTALAPPLLIGLLLVVIGVS